MLPTGLSGWEMSLSSAAHTCHTYVDKKRHDSLTPLLLLAVRFGLSCAPQNVTKEASSILRGIAKATAVAHPT